MFMYFSPFSPTQRTRQTKYGKTRSKYGSFQTKHIAGY